MNALHTEQLHDKKVSEYGNSEEGTHLRNIPLIFPLL